MSTIHRCTHSQKAAMYSLRNRDLTSLVGGVEASEAAKTDLWLNDEVPGSSLPHTRDRARPGSARASSLLEYEQLQMSFEELTKAYKELKTRFDNRGAEMTKLHDRIRRLERRLANPTKEKPHTTSMLTCQQSCCIPLARLEKAGLNVDAVLDLDAKWAGYVFSILSGQARSSGRTMYEIFRKYADAHGRIDEGAFRNLIRQFIPSMPEDRLTRLFYFADSDGSGTLNLLEFLRLFGVDVNGKMGEEYFEHVMVRMRRAVAKAGGLIALLKLQDRYLNRNYSRQKLVDAIGPLATSLSRAEIFEAVSRFLTTGSEVKLHDLHDAMELCASSAFVSEDWVHKLFKSVTLAIQRQHKDLKSVLKAFGPTGTVSREDLRAFLHQFQPTLGDSHIDRVYGFLCASFPSGTGNFTVSHLVESICRPSLGPVQMGSNRSRLPLEDTSRLAVQLSQLCGGLERAFENLNPCLLYEEFAAALQSLGFSHAFDFEKIFAVLDVHRSGRVPKAIFMSVLERFVSLEEGKKDEKREEVKPNDLDERLQYFREILQHRRQLGRNQAVPAALHEELLWEFQRAVNRLLVLESELQYRQRLEERDDLHMRRGLLDQVRDLEAAQARLTARKPGQMKQENVQEDARIPEAWSIGYKEGKSASASEIARLQNELDIAKEEKVKLSWQLAFSQQDAASAELAAYEERIDDSDEAADEDGSKVRFGHVSDEGDRDQAESAMREALRLFARSHDAEQFALRVRGISIAGRFIVKGLLAAEFDAVVLACGDAFNMRELTLRVPIVDSARKRLNFLRECCVYTVLSEVAEVQDVIHFPGLTSGLAYCVMERLHGRLLSNHLQRIRSGRPWHCIELNLGCM